MRRRTGIRSLSVVRIKLRTPISVSLALTAAIAEKSPVDSLDLYSIHWRNLGLLAAI
jgi:hypothetical protein